MGTLPGLWVTVVAANARQYRLGHAGCRNMKASHALRQQRMHSATAPGPHEVCSYCKSTNSKATTATSTKVTRKPSRQVPVNMDARTMLAPKTSGSWSLHPESECLTNTSCRSQSPRCLAGMDVNTLSRKTSYRDPSTRNNKARQLRWPPRTSTRAPSGGQQ